MNSKSIVTKIIFGLSLTSWVEFSTYDGNAFIIPIVYKFSVGLSQQLTIGLIPIGILCFL